MVLRSTFAVSAAVLAVAVSSCGSTTTVKEQPDQTTATSAPAKPAPAKKPAGVGDSITLNGEEGLRMKVTLVRVIDPVPVGEFDEPQAGNRFVGVVIRLENVSSVAYDDSPSNGATLIHGADEQADATIVTGGVCASGFASQAKIAPAGRRQGCIPFELPSASKLKTFQFTLLSGFGPDTGEWSLEATAHSAASSSGEAGTAGQLTKADVVKRIAAILDFSSAGRAASQAGRFDEAATNRRETLQRVEELDARTDQLGTQLALLKAAAQASLDAVRAYQDCGGVDCAPDASAAASAAKRAFVEAFNPEASRYLGRTFEEGSF
jgi:Domain of unknown function (DUF4352)